MELFIICIQLLVVRLIDITIGTVRTLFLVRNKNKIAAICGFFEVLIWFYAVDSALNNEINSIWIPISYAAGFSLGTLLGTIIAKKFINPLVSVQIISNKLTKKEITNIKDKGYGVSVIKLENNEHKNSKMLIIETHHYNLKHLMKLISSIDNKAFIFINDIRNYYNGYINLKSK